MSTSKIESGVKILEYTNTLCSPVTIDDQMYCVSQNGDIIKVNSLGQYQIVFTILGHPSSLCFRVSSNSFLVGDFAHESIFMRQHQGNDQINNLISQYQQHAFHGPNCMKIGQLSHCLYFTDSGPFMETSLENPVGSLYVYRFEDKTLRALIHRKLAYPCGIEIQEDQRYLLLCQMGNNLILKVILDQNYSGNYSIFHQFEGKIGPSCISYSDETYYVGLFQFKQITQNGTIALLNKLGELIERIILPIGPQITGIYLLPNQNTLGTVGLITQSNKLHQITFKNQRTQSRDQSSLMISK